MSLLSVIEAQERILEHFKPAESETLALSQCAGRVLASDIISSDLPFFDNSSVDGFAVIAADLAKASQANPRTLHVVADIPAGSWADVLIAHGSGRTNYDRRAAAKRRRCSGHGRGY